MCSLRPKRWVLPCRAAYAFERADVRVQVSRASASARGLPVGGASPRMDCAASAETGAITFVEPTRATLRVMERLNLTLDSDTAAALGRIADADKKPRAAVARDLILEALKRREARAWRERLARDYAAGRADAQELLGDLESAQLDLIGDEDQ